MHPALTFQFERAVNEYAQWQAVPTDERSDAPALVVEHCDSRHR